MADQAIFQKLINSLLWNFGESRSLEDPSIPLSSKNIDTFFNIGQTNESGVNVTEATALTFAAVYRAVVLRGDTLASLPIHVFENLGNGKKQIVKDHPVSFLLGREPNELQTAFSMRQAASGNHDLWGNIYAVIRNDQKGEPISIDLKDPETAEVKRRGRQLWYVFRETIDGKSETTTVPMHQVLHIPNFSRNGVVGTGIVQNAAESLGSALAQQKFGSRFFKNNAQPSGILTSQNATDTQAKESKAAWQKANAGTNTGGTSVLRGDWKYDTITIPPDQAQFLQSREFSVVEVARWFGVEPHLLFDLKRSSYNSIEQQSIEFAVYTIMGLVRKWEQEIDRKMFSLEDRKKNKYYTKFNINALLRADIKSRGDWYRTLVQNGIMEINEVRQLEDMNAQDYGDVAFIQKNMQRLDYSEPAAKKELEDE